MGYSISWDHESVTFDVEHVSGNDCYILYYRKASVSTASSKTLTRTGDFTYTISGLSPDTDYVVNVGYDTDHSNGYTNMGSQTFTTDPDPSSGASDIDPWSWTASNGSATAAQTKAAYNVLMGTATVENFSHKVWNDFVDKVAEVNLAVSEYGDDWSIGGGNYIPKDECYVSAGDTLSAEIYNSVRYNIGSLVSTGITNVSPGDEITGYHIIRLAERLNDYINTL